MASPCAAWGAGRSWGRLPRRPPAAEREGRLLSALELLVRTADACGAESLRPLAEHLPASARRDAALGLRGRPDAACGLAGLTAQELQVATLVADGLSDREAAAQLYLSPKTIEYHLAHIFAKLGIRTRYQLAARIRPRTQTRPGGRCARRSGRRSC